MAYFENFKYIFYDLSNNPQHPAPVIVRNIMQRATIRENLKKAALIYYTYQVKEGDTPEIVAHKYYGDPELHWLVLMVNNIIDPQYDWPLDQDTFQSYLINLYGSVATAQTTTHHYEKNVLKTDNSTGISTHFDYIIDLDTYTALPATDTDIIAIGTDTVTIVTTKSAITCYDYEYNLNQHKRNIKLIDKRYAGQIANELKTVLKQ